MRIHRTPVGIVIETPAKLNLFFEVLGKRQDGYHEIETLMCPIDLFDTLSFVDQPGGGVELHCRWGGFRDAQGAAAAGSLPRGPDNLAWRAVDLIRRRARVHRGARLRLLKRIPMAAGLGGGSSDAAAALVAANFAWNLHLPLAELSAMAAELGSDVPFFLVGGPAVCRGRGEIVEPVARLGLLHFVLAAPPGGLSTAAVYQACRPADQPRTAGPLLEVLTKGDLVGAGRQLLNRLQPAAETLSPWVPRLREIFSRAGVLGNVMSGSGTSYFGLCRHARHARRTARRLQASGIGGVFSVRSCREGVLCSG